jgi:hypothetical protein
LLRRVRRRPKAIPGFQTQGLVRLVCGRQAGQPTISSTRPGRLVWCATPCTSAGEQANHAGPNHHPHQREPRCAPKRGPWPGLSYMPDAGMSQFPRPELEHGAGERPAAAQPLPVAPIHPKAQPLFVPGSLPRRRLHQREIQTDQLSGRSCALGSRISTPSTRRNRAAYSSETVHGPCLDRQVGC